MDLPKTLPNGRVLLEGLGLTLERLQTGSKVAVPLPVIRAILLINAANMPFDPEFYVATYPDLREAYEGGKIKDLRAHFIEVGYLEGRMGAEPPFDDVFYRKTYPDVAAALSNGSIKSAIQHYIYSGAFEGRHPAASEMDANKHWADLFRAM